MGLSRTVSEITAISVENRFFGQPPCTLRPIQTIRKCRERMTDRQTDRHMLRKLECRVDAETASVWCVLHTQGTANTTPCINRLRSGCYPLNFVTCFRLEKRLRTVLHGEKVWRFVQRFRHKWQYQHWTDRQTDRQMVHQYRAARMLTLDKNKSWTKLLSRDYKGD